MERVIGRYSPYLYAALRIVTGFLFMLHGTQKFFGFPVKFPVPLTAMTTTGGVIELVAGLMVLVGLFSGFAAFVASGEMAVAYFLVHQPQGPLPIQNNGELAALLAFVLLYIASRGSGPFSVDALLGRRTYTE